MKVLAREQESKRGKVVRIQVKRREESGDRSSGAADGSRVATDARLSTLPASFAPCVMSASLILDLQIFLFAVFVLCILAVTGVMTTRLYLISSCGSCSSSKSMAGKVAIVTGSNTGIGKEAAKDLALRGARVILACRDLKKAEAAAAEIRAANSRVHVVAKYCDLASLKSVRNFADDIMSSETRLDVLLCNAGAGAPFGRHLTEDGFEMQFQTNHLGHFLLINLLLELMKRSPSGARIVITSSLAHRFGRVDLSNMARAEQYTSHPFLTYCDTKLLNVILAKQLARLLQATSVTANALHPGTIYTNGIRFNEIWYVKLFLLFMCYIYGHRSEQQGAQTLIHLAVAEELEGVSGQYFADCLPANYNPLADDASLGDEVWRLSCRLAGLDKT